MISELEDLITIYGDERRTDIDDRDLGGMSVEDLITQEDMTVTLTHEGFIKRTSEKLYKSQRRGGGRKNRCHFKK